MKAYNAQRLGSAETIEQEIIRLCKLKGSSLDREKRLMELIGLVGGCSNLGPETFFQSKDPLFRREELRLLEPQLEVRHPKNGRLISPLIFSRVQQSEFPEILKRLSDQIQLLTDLEKLKEEKN
jgi:hypothetical protein